MEKISLKVKTRKETGKKIKTLRTQGNIPAVLYGHEIKNVNLAVPYHEFEKVYAQAGESTLLDLIIDNQPPLKVLIQAIQKDPISGNFSHIDFYQVKMTEKIEAEIELKFINTAPAVTDLEGTLVTNLDTINVKCYPQDLVSEIAVDLSALKTFDDHIFVKDLVVPAKMELLDNPKEVVAGVVPPRTEEELKALEEKPEAAKEAEVVGKEKEAAESEKAAGTAAENTTEEKTMEKKK